MFNIVNVMSRLEGTLVLVIRDQCLGFHGNQK